MRLINGTEQSLSKENDSIKKSLMGFANPVLFLSLRQRVVHDAEALIGASSKEHALAVEEADLLDGGHATLLPAKLAKISNHIL